MDASCAELMMHIAILFFTEQLVGGSNLIGHNPWLLKALIQSDAQTSLTFSPDFILIIKTDDFYWCLKNALDHHLHHLHLCLLPNFVVKKGILCQYFFSLFAFVLFLYFVHDSSAVLMGILKNWGRRWNKKWKVTRKDQLKAATYEWLL